MDNPSSLETRTGCIAAAMAVIGTKWTALILRDLAAGPQRFADFEASIPSLNPRTLSRRLDDLEANDIICRCPGSTRYELTKKGRGLVPVLEQMAAWGDKYA